MQNRESGKIYSKLLIVGSVGSGKTQIVETLSEIGTLNTDVESSVDIGKNTTTVGIDYGRINFGENHSLGLYGTPGQDRYSFIWESLKESLWGILILVKTEEKIDVENFTKWINFFEIKEKCIPLIVATTHGDQSSATINSNTIATLNNVLLEHEILAPVIPVDARDRSQAITLLNTLNTLSIEK